MLKGIKKTIKEEKEKFAQVLEKRGLNWKSFIQKYFAISFLICIAAIIIFGIRKDFENLAYLGIFAIVPLIGYFLENFFYENQKKKMEDRVAEMLLHASIFPKGTDIIEIIDYLGNADIEIISREFKKAKKEIKKGKEVKKALGQIKKRWQSLSLDRAIDLMIMGYENGSDMSHSFRQAAEDCIKNKEILMDRNASLIVEKYTLLFAGAVLVPLVLGFIVNMVENLNINSNFLINAKDLALKKEVLDALKTAIPIYIIEYSLIASVFTAYQENHIKKAVFYVILVLPISLISYFMSNLLL